jgi:hypothetical protein
MGDLKNYRKRAQECANLAARTQSPEHKATWLALEQHWLRLADSLELYEQFDPFTAFLTSARASR